MKKTSLLLIPALAAWLWGCASPPPPQASHNTDDSALVVQSFDGHSCQVLAPTAISRGEASAMLDRAKTLPKHQTAVIILENYAEPQLGAEFRDRSMAWFIGLRGLGYQHIVFLKGNGGNDTNGLLTLADTIELNRQGAFAVPLRLPPADFGLYFTPEI